MSDEEDIDVAVERFERPDPDPDPSEDPLTPPPGEIPMYNPLHVTLDVNYGGDFTAIGPGKVAYVPKAAALHAVGEDNLGGALSGCGLRRLYWEEARFAEAAEKAGVSLLSWVVYRNAKTIEEADKVGAVFISKHVFPQKALDLVPEPEE